MKSGAKNKFSKENMTKVKNYENYIMTSCTIFQVCCGLKLAKLVLLTHRINNQRDYIEELSLQTPQQKKKSDFFF